jgi:hypothetical protein
MYFTEELLTNGAPEPARTHMLVNCQDAMLDFEHWGRVPPRVAQPTRL